MAKPKRGGITQAELLELFEYDPDTGELTNKVNRGVARAGNMAGFELDHGYLGVKIHGVQYLVHRVIWCMVYGEFPLELTDHINGVTSDNRIINLRAVGYEDNSRNAKIPTNNTSKVVGVHWHNKHRKWRAFIYANNKQIHLGMFNTMQEAATAREIAEKELGYHENHGRVGKYK